MFSVIACSLLISCDRNILNQGYHFLYNGLFLPHIQYLLALAVEILLAEFPCLQMPFRNNLDRRFPGAYANPVQFHAAFAGLISKFLSKLAEQIADLTTWRKFRSRLHFLSFGILLNWHAELASLGSDDCF